MLVKDIYSQGTVGHFVLPDRNPGPAVAGVTDPCHHQNHQEEESQQEVVEIPVAVDGIKQQHRPFYAEDAVGATGQAIEIVEEYLDDLAEAECYDGQVITFQAQGRDAEQDAEQHGHEASQRQRYPETAEGVPYGQNGTGIGADGVESDEPEDQHPGQPDRDIEGRCQDRVDQGGDKHIEKV